MTSTSIPIPKQYQQNTKNQSTQQHQHNRIYKKTNNQKSRSQHQKDHYLQLSGHSLVTRNRSAPETANFSSVTNSTASGNITISSSSFSSNYQQQPPSTFNLNVNPISATTTSSSSLFSLNYFDHDVHDQANNHNYDYNHDYNQQSSLSLSTVIQTVPGTASNNKDSNNVWSYDQSIRDNGVDSWDNHLVSTTTSSSSTSSSSSISTSSSKRDKIFFHLSAIFSRATVEHAMAMLPDETDPQKICATIIKLEKS